MLTRLASFALLRAITLAVVATLAACQATPPRTAVESDLKLLTTSPLVVPEGCMASGAFAVSFTVATTGRTDAIRAPDAPNCVQDALIAWVASFRYEPPSRATPTTMEWMMVTAKRGS